MLIFQVPSPSQWKLHQKANQVALWNRMEKLVRRELDPGSCSNLIFYWFCTLPLLNKKNILTSEGKIQWQCIKLFCIHWLCMRFLGFTLIFTNFNWNIIAKFTTLAVDIPCWIYNIIVNWAIPFVNLGYLSLVILRVSILGSINFFNLFRF